MGNNFEVKLSKLRFEYEFLETYESGIELKGNEVKLIKSKNFSFIDAYCFFRNGELFVKNFIITDAEDPKREKKLLLKKQELDKLQKSLIKGLTIVPYTVFTNDKGRVKCNIVLSRRKKNYDKKQKIKERDLDREKNLDSK
jgi:SsrA-binding protein